MNEEQEPEPDMAEVLGTDSLLDALAAGWEPPPGSDDPGVDLLVAFRKDGLRAIYLADRELARLRRIKAAARDLIEGRDPLTAYEQLRDALEQGRDDD